MHRKKPVGLFYPRNVNSSYLWWWDYEWLLFSSLCFYILAKFYIMSILYFYNHTNYFNLNSVSPKHNGTRAPSYVSFQVIFTWIGSGFGEPNLITPVGLRLQPNLNTNQNGLCLDSRLEQIWTDLFTRYFPVGPMGGRSGDGRAACSPSVGGARVAMTPAPHPPVAQPPPPLPFSYASLSRPSASSPCSYPGSASLPLSWNHTHWGWRAGSGSGKVL